MVGRFTKQWLPQPDNPHFDGRPWKSVNSIFLFCYSDYETESILFGCNHVIDFPRFAEVRKTLQGKLEERLPFFSFIFPEEFKQRYSKEYVRFKQNVKRLATPFDVHETFLDLLRKYLTIKIIAFDKFTAYLPNLMVFSCNWRYSTKGWVTEEALCTAKRQTKYDIQSTDTAEE